MHQEAKFDVLPMLKLVENERVLFGHIWLALRRNQKQVSEAKDQHEQADGGLHVTRATI